ncbi:MAG TPA: enoyl-CoA hydratase-related protein [Longimicrobiales bacterium]|nr:enoyl-CoA hydratase-related protein [Longimicrobiales bacterium]
MKPPKWELIRYEEDGGVRVVSLARPEKRNALNEQLLDELFGALLEAQQDEAARVVLLRADGPDFCSGADLSQLEQVASGASPMENLLDAHQIGDLLVAIRAARFPVIAAVQGRAWAGGAGLATACDMVLAAEDASLAWTEIRLGFVPAMVMAVLRRVVGEKVAFELIATGEPIDAQRARELGLVNRVLPNEGFDDAARAFARDIATRSPSGLELSKRLFYGSEGLSFENAIARGAEVNALARMTPDTREGVRAFLEKKRKG